MHQPRQIYASTADRRHGRRWSGAGAAERRRGRRHRSYRVPVAVVALALVAGEAVRSLG